MNSTPVCRALASELLCTRGNITRLVARMTTQGLISTVGDPNDQRLVRVRITERGADRLAHAEELLAEANARRFAALPSELLDEAREGLARFVEALRRDLDENPA